MYGEILLIANVEGVIYRCKYYLLTPTRVTEHFKRVENHPLK